MLEDRPCLFPGVISFSEENIWYFMNPRLEITALKGKRPLMSEEEEELRLSKLSKLSRDIKKLEMCGTRPDLNLAPSELPNGYDGDSLGLTMHSIDQAEFACVSPDLSSAFADHTHPADLGDLDLTPTDLSLTLASQSSNQGHAGDHSNAGSLISPLGRDNSVSCLIRCSRSYYGFIASLNQSFRSLIRSGELYRARRLNGMIEHWIYFSCQLVEWVAFDPIFSRWMQLPRMPTSEHFMCSDKESLAVGTEVLVFTKEVMDHVIFRYSLLTNSWSSGMRMNSPRCLFGSASFGEKAILAGGCDQGVILSSAEFFNCETGTWEMLPCMNKPRKMCSAVFMDGNFYVIGGIGGAESKRLTCGEEFNLKNRTWTEIPNMSPKIGGERESEMHATVAPPLVAVVNNELYAANYLGKTVMKYDKNRKDWDEVGRLPERLVSMNGWGLAFRACGDRLVVIGGPRASMAGRTIEINSWVPREGPIQWNVIAERQLGNFVFNCAVMGC